MGKLTKLLVGLLLAVGVCAEVQAQSAVIRGESSAGIYETIKTDGAQHLQVVLATTPSINSTDPCQSSAIAKSSVPINISTATTTALVAVSASTTVYVCSFSLTISQVITTANTLQFEYGTGAACAGAPTVLTGLYGAGGVTAAAPIVITGLGGTIFKTPAANGLCAVTAIGATGSFQGVLTYVQQ